MRKSGWADPEINFVRVDVFPIFLYQEHFLMYPNKILTYGSTLGELNSWTFFERKTFGKFKTIELIANTNNAFW